MTLIWDYTLNWIKGRKILLSNKYTKSHLIDKAMTLEPDGLNRRDELL